MCRNLYKICNMASKHELLKTKLKEKGYSLTAPRLAVFDALVGQEPQSMTYIIDKVGKSADRASVYRTVELYEKLSIIKRLHIGWKHKLELSDTFSRHHHHLTCLRCGKIIALSEDPIFERSIKLLALKERFLPKEHLLEIQGICESCQTKPA
jgi:Fur family ferric uptake transcriptional regulator